MKASELLKQLKDDGWYLGDTEGSSRQYRHRTRPGFVTVCVRFTDQLGPQTLEAAQPGDATTTEPELVVESTSTGASAFASGMPGCVATGVDEDEARTRLAEALTLHRRALGQVVR